MIQDINLKSTILSLYREAGQKYKGCSKPSNYIVQYIKRRIDYKSVEELYSLSFSQILYCTINNINKVPTCHICGKSVNFIGFGQGFSSTCSVKCGHSSEEYKEKASATHIGKSRPTKGKTYLEIYGTQSPGCGFKKGKDNPNFDPVLKEKSNESLRRYYRNHPEAIEKKRQHIYNRKEYFINSKKLKFKNSRDEKFRSRLEVQFSELLIENNIPYKYEVSYKLLNGRRKVVDFVVDNFLLVEISGYAYEKWRQDFDKKLDMLRKSTDSSILILTYPHLVTELRIRNFIGRNIYFDSIDNSNHILRGINFYKSILTFNKEVCIK